MREAIKTYQIEGSDLQVQLTNDDVEKIMVDAVLEKSISTVGIHAIHACKLAAVSFAGAYIHAYRLEDKGKLWREYSLNISVNLSTEKAHGF